MAGSRRRDPGGLSTVRWAACALALATTTVSLAPAASGDTGIVRQASGPPQSQTSDTLQVVKAGEQPTPAELSAELAERALVQADRVLIARDDNFADALASGMLQADAPLLLVPSGGPVPDVVMSQVRRLGASAAVLLGGSAAVSDSVEQQLQDAGLAVARRAGTSRIETAVRIAELDGPQATHALLVRAFPSAGGAESQAFADTLAAGGLAAERGWPILLTASDQLSAATEAHLRSSAITHVTVVGGPAAVSPEVEQAVAGLGLTVDRLAGSTRADTAVVIAESRTGTGLAQAGGGDVVLVEGFSEDAWIGGFAAATWSAVNDAPIVLAAQGTLPPETQAFMDGRAPATVDDPALLCVVDATVCEEGRQTMGLPAAADVQVQPGDGQPVTAGQAITVTVSAASGLEGPMTVGGSCLPAPTSHPAGGTATVSAADPLPGGACTVTVVLHHANGTTQVATTVHNGAVSEPDGAVVLFVERASEPDPGAGLYRINVDGTRREQLFACQQCSAPVASPDGLQVYSTHRDPVSGLATVLRLDAPGFDRASTVWQAVSESASIATLHLTPAGDALVFHVTDFSGGSSGLWTVRIDGTSPRQISTDDQQQPVAVSPIAPSGPGGALEVLVNHNRVGEDGLINLETGAKRVFPTEIDTGSGALAPDGRHVLVQHNGLTGPGGQQGCRAMLDLSTNAAACLQRADGLAAFFGGFTPSGTGFYSVNGGDLVIGDVATATVGTAATERPFLPGLCGQVNCGGLIPSPDVSAFAQGGITLIETDPFIVRTIEPGGDRSFLQPTWLRLTT